MRARVTSEQAAASSQERKRQNRAYMRRWRANAQHRRLELSQQQRWRLEQKLKLRVATRTETRVVPSGIVVWITKAKKFSQSPQFLQFPQAGSAASRTTLPGVEGGPPQGWGGNPRHPIEGAEVPVRIDTREIDKHNTKQAAPLLKYVRNSTSQAKNGEKNGSLAAAVTRHGTEGRLIARAASRESALRQELALGAGPQLKCANGDEGG